MTQKSFARKQRDLQEKERKQTLNAHLKDNRNWDDLHTRYAECCQLLQEPTGVVEIMRDAELMRFIPADQVGALNTNNSLLARDLRELLNELKLIYGKHSGRRGNATEADVMEGFAIYELYVLWLQRYNSLIPPTVAHILEITSQAEQRRQAALTQLAAQKAQDPTDNSVIDVVATEVKTPQAGDSSNAAV